MKISVKTNAEQETFTMGKELGQILEPGNIVTIEGDLGAGKTAFAKGVAAGLGIDEHVTSPTFTIVNQYMGKIPLYHFDVYRLDDALDLEELGYEEYFYDRGICLIEWPEKIEELLPEQLLKVQIIKGAQVEERIINIVGHGAAYEMKVEELKNLVGIGN